MGDFKKFNKGIDFYIVIEQDLLPLINKIISKLNETQKKINNLSLEENKYEDLQSLIIQFKLIFNQLSNIGYNLKEDVFKESKKELNLAIKNFKFILKKRQLLNDLVNKGLIEEEVFKDINHVEEDISELNKKLK